MRHSENHFTNPQARSAFNDRIQHGNRRLGPLKRKPLLAQEFSMQESFEGLCLHQAL